MRDAQAAERRALAAEKARREETERRLDDERRSGREQIETMEGALAQLESRSAELERELETAWAIQLDNGGAVAELQREREAYARELHELRARVSTYAARLREAKQELERRAPEPSATAAPPQPADPVAEPEPPAPVGEPTPEPARARWPFRHRG
jgi:chromosome segregation ATPase